MKILFKTNYAELKENNGWVYVHRPNCKGIIIIIPVINDSVLFLKTKRPPLISEGITGYNIELPAGLIGDENKNETILESAKRELLEETGLICDEFKLLTKNLTSSAGITDEISTVYVAKISDKKIIQKPDNDGGVITSSELVKIKDIPSFIKKEEENDNTIGAQTLSALFLFLCDNGFNIN